MTRILVRPGYIIKALVIACYLVLIWALSARVELGVKWGTLGKDFKVEDGFLVPD